MKTTRKEKGQILVILALALVAMLAVTALAVDGSMIYNERRKDQSAADSVALAAAQEATKTTYTTCESAKAAAISKAISYGSAQAGITLADDAVSPSRVEATCSGDNTTLDIRIVVTSDTPTTFAQMVSRDQLTTTVETVSRVTFGSSSAFAGGAGLWATGPTCDANGGIWLEGEGRIAVSGGGVYSRSCISIKTSTSFVITDGNPIQYSGKIGTHVNAVNVGTSPTKTVYLGKSGEFGSNGIMLAYWQKSFVLVTSSTATPGYGYQITGATAVNTSIPKEQWPDYVPPVDTPTLTYEMEKPNCTVTASFPDRGTPPGTTTNYYEGLYTSMFIDSNTGATLHPGTYCIKPGGSVVFDEGTNIANETHFYFQGIGTFRGTGGFDKLTMNNSSIYLTQGDFKIDQGLVNAQNITVYIKQGSFIMSNGNFGCTMSAPNCSDSSCGVGPSLKGVLVYMPISNTGTFEITEGNGAHTLTGTVYAPNALARLTGGSKVHTNDFQLIAKRIYLNGSATLTLDTNNGNLYSGGSSSTSIELRK